MYCLVMKNFYKSNPIFQLYCRLDNKIQWFTDYKQYRTDADALSVMLDDNQNKLESCEKPTSNKAERDKQASFLNVSLCSFCDKDGVCLV